MHAERIRIRGTVQGVGFRPTVARLAQGRGLAGFVRNDSEGVLIGLRAERSACEAFVRELLASLPALARVEAVERTPDPGLLGLDDGFFIEASQGGPVRTSIPPDAAACPQCMAEVLNPYERRYRYPFATCTLCGPRYSIATAVPFDRASTTLSGFELCEACQAEYEAPGDRRFHAQAIACHTCGPRAWLERGDARAFSLHRYTMMDAVDAVAGLIAQGEIVAVKGIGGFHLCCDATQPEVVDRLRSRKRRLDKPFALMARDLEGISNYAQLGPAEERALRDHSGPIVLLEPREAPALRPLASSVAPGQRYLGFMLPYSPLHRLMLSRLSQPIVCTSGNVSDEPQCIEDEDARKRLGGIADWFLFHNRPIHARVDDSVVRVAAGRVRVVRRARGMAPEPTPMPPGLRDVAPIFAAGGQLKSTFAVVQDGRALMSPHLGDLDAMKTIEAYSQAQALLGELFTHRAEVYAVDLHPEYRASQMAREAAETHPVSRVVEVQHHHAHVAAVMAEHGRPADAAPVLGIALDGLGLGLDGELWGGEFLLTTYASMERVATFKPVALLGGDVAARQPWRSLYAHLRAGQSWPELLTHHGDVSVVRALEARRSPVLESSLASGLHSPKSSSCGRLFDAVAASVGICFDSATYEGQAAAELEALAGPEDISAAAGGERYPVAVPRLPGGGLPYLEFLGMWRAILGDLAVGTAPALISARFHIALAEALARVAVMIRNRVTDLDTVVLAGGCFQNRLLLEHTDRALRVEGFQTLLPERYPAHDGGLALGQAAVAAAQVRRI